MLKKMLGGILIIYSVLSFIGMIPGNSFNSVTLILQLLIAISGIFLIIFDSVHNKTYVEGFKARKKQCAVITAFMLLDLLIFISSMVSILINAGNGVYLSGQRTVYVLLTGAVPFIIYVGMYAAYVLPYKACRKYFLNNDNAINEYLGADYESFSRKNSVLANEKALFFPDLYCVVPKDAVKEIEFKQVLFEQDVYFHLTNGKKFYLVTTQYNNIMNAYKG